MAGVQDCLHRVPRAELHVHLRGAIPEDVLLDLLNKYSADEVWRRASAEWRSMFEAYANIRPFLSPSRWSAGEVSTLFDTETFEQFVATYAFVGYFVRTSSDLRKLILGVVEQLKAQNVVYAEITASIYRYMHNGITLPEIGACLEEAAHDPGIKVQWILGLVRDYGSEATLRLLRDVIDLGCDSVVGITLAGSEHLYPPAQFAEVYSLARDYGLRLTAHAGEVQGSQSIWDALRILGVERVGHGVTAVEDESLVQYLAENQIPLEVCPTSNVRTGVCMTYDAHPIKPLFEAGVPITINTDDPTFFQTTLSDEYAHLYDLGLGDSDIYEIVENGFRYAFLPPEEVGSYVSDLRRAWDDLRPGP